MEPLVQEPFIFKLIFAVIAIIGVMWLMDGKKD